MPILYRGTPKKYATCKKRERGKLNKGESAYARHLDLRMAAGEVLWCAFEGMTLKIADDCRITPDFAVMEADGTMVLVDVKGRSGDKYWAEEDAVVKLKTLAEIYPFQVFVVWPKKDSGWNVQEVKPGPVVRTI